MAPERSHADAGVGHQLYPVLEQCKKPEVLWAKLATGKYDWLGVRRNGRYVLGRPRLSPVVPEAPARSPDPVEDAHRVECTSPVQRVPRWEAFETRAEAEETFLRMVEGDPITPLQSSGVWRVRLVVHGRSVDERLVVRPLPRMV
jgi:hypothetical protein